ncbi:sigma-54-dependent Fis family transcriptional regulator [candidate division KSB1 bacterium]|nr:sigma-54-dependent Fis family transcriptional regulator [candidate division KSB1 bacterium]
MYRVLIVDDQAPMLTSTKHIIQKMNCEVKTSTNSEEAIRLIISENFDLIICDLLVPELEDGLAIIDAAREQANSPGILVMSAYDSIDNVVKAMQEGADDFISKGFTVDGLRIKIEKLLSSHQIAQRQRIEKQLFEEHLHKTFGDYKIIGKSSKIRELIELIHRVAEFDKTTCLIEGETGTGKELVARAIHRNSKRKHGPFVDINCASVPDELIENELFGHDKGAFTSAVSNQQGKFEWASGGVIFLDEIGEMNLRAQAKLLRVIENNQFNRLGSNKVIKTDVMIIAATNKNLSELIAEGKFREDLYFRLNVVRITTPPLRENLEDIPLLVDYFISQINQNYMTHKTVSEEVIQVLKSYEYPGNVRELRNILENAYIQTSGNIISKQHLWIEPITTNHEHIKLKGSTASPLKKAVHNFEREFITRALEKNFWNITRTAAALGISREGLIKKMKRLNIDK